MKSKGFKLVSLLLLVVMLMTACSGGKTDTNSGSGDSKDTNTGDSSSTDKGEPTELKVMIWDRGSAAPGTTNEENTLTEYIQKEMLENYNIKVSYMTVPRSGSDDKVNVMMAGGNAPDIVFTYSQTMYGDYATKGGLADLTDALSTYGTNINKFIGDIQVMGTMDGKQYAIMKRRGVQVPRHITYIRKDWLDALGMDMPTNKKELEDALVAFKEQNPGGVDNVIPWAMGGSADTEKFYLNFIGSYVPKMSEKDAYVYNEAMKIFADGGLEGLKEMNRLYNMGLISQDFAVDTTTDQYKQDVSAGNAGFILDDSTSPFDYIPVLQKAVDGAELIPLNVLDTPEGDYINPTEPLYGMYIMVPKTSEDKVNAAVQYLDWLADPTNAENVNYSPEHTVSEAGVPIPLKEEEAKEKGYPGNPYDYCIVNDHLKFVDTKAGVVESWMGATPFEDKEWYENLYDVMNVNQFVYPSVPVVLEAEAENYKIVQGLAIEYVYKMISCPSDEFDELQKTEYKKLVDAGLEKIFAERAAYYDENMAK